MNNTLVVHDAFKDVIKLIGNSFEIRPEIYTNEFSTGNVKCEISYYDDRTLFRIYILDHPKLQIITLSFYRDCKITRIRIDKNCNDIVSTMYSTCHELFISKWLEPLCLCKLNYPLQEDEYFQQLTLYPLPPVEDIQKFMDLGEYILGSNTNFKGYAISWYEHIEVYYSLLEIVQEVQECVLQLIKREGSDGHISS